MVKDCNMYTITRAERLEYAGASTWHRTRWLERVLGIYDEMRESVYSRRYQFKVNGRRIEAYQDVYAPGFFTDTAWFAPRVAAICRGASVLEIGTGTGAIAIECARRGAAAVCATDINLGAVENTRYNFAEHRVNGTVIHGDVYDGLPSPEKYDIIFWAHPFNNVSWPVGDLLLQSGMDTGYESVHRYILGAKDHLLGNGRLFLGTGNTADLQSIGRFARQNGYFLRCLDWETLPLQDSKQGLVTYLFLELCRNPKKTNCLPASEV